MSSIQEIESAVSQLPTQQLAEFRAWFAEYDAQAWERQVEADATTGRLDDLASEALQEYQAGRTRPL